MNEWTELMREGLKALDLREQAVLTLRFGLGDDERCRTLKDTGAFYNITGEAARRIQNKALDKLRRYVKKNQ